MLPSLFLSRLQNILGDDLNQVLDAFAKNRKGSFRLNKLKTNGADVLREFEERGIVLDIYPEIDGVFLFDREFEYSIKGSQAFYNGNIYLQSIASMLPVLALMPKYHENILDVCAAPGSKTTQMAMLMNNTGSITAIEQNQIRYDKLMYNCKLQGATNIHGIKGDALWVLQDSDVGLYDRILLDAPCSAEGRINSNNEKSYGFWSLENITKKAELQSNLLIATWDHLVPGGTLIYSTCTLAPEENEAVIINFLTGHPDAILEPIELPFTGGFYVRPGLAHFGDADYSYYKDFFLRILPSQITEGFFLAKIRKQ